MAELLAGAAVLFGRHDGVSTYKSMIPKIVPFYADTWLAEFDEWMHGAAPWELAHRFDNDLWALFVFKNYEVAVVCAVVRHGSIRRHVV